ncbi:MAG: hypothetical protein AAFQ14_16200 [Cyanobacteria bacterium J06621_12]
MIYSIKVFRQTSWHEIEWKKERSPIIPTQQLYCSGASLLFIA